MISLSTPLTERKVRNLRVGDIVQISGIIYTARDTAHKFLLEKPGMIWKEKLKNSIIFHCGPIVKKSGRVWKIVSLGPTTSIRMELYEPKLIKTYRIRGIIGKGGMDKNTLKALKKYGCVYLLAIGGTAALLTQSVKEVKNVYMLKEFGVPEAIWELKVENFPTIVTMDTHGKSIHEQVLTISNKIMRKIVNRA